MLAGDGVGQDEWQTMYVRLVVMMNGGQRYRRRVLTVSNKHHRLSIAYNYGGISLGELST